MLGLVKIGRSINGGEERAKAIYQTGVPTPFILEFELYAADHEYLEQLIHDRLNDHRVNQYREFFRVDVYECISHLMATYLDNCTPLCHSIVTSEEKNAIDDLHYLSHITQLGLGDVYQAIVCLPKGAIEESLETRQRLQREIKQKQDAYSDNPFAVIEPDVNEAANG
jgi:hypothetical protein